MPVVTGEITLHTRGNTDIHNITDTLAQLVAQAGLKSGVVTIFCPSSTSALTTIEYEPGCLSDLRRLFEEILPSNREYSHNAAWDDGNGHSHARAALLGPSISIPFIKGRLTLGTWQQVIHVDFDIRPRSRELVVQMVGE